MPGVVCTSPPPPTATTMPSTLTSHTTTTSTQVVWRHHHSLQPWPDSESGIEDSPDSVDGGMMPLSPPIPIPSPRRSSLQPSQALVSPPTQEEPQQSRTSVSAPAGAAATHEDDSQPPPPPTPATSTPPAAPEASQPPEEGAADEAGHEVPTIQISEVQYWASPGWEVITTSRLDPSSTTT